jgi:hypothetical protein
LINVVVSAGPDSTTLTPASSMSDKLSETWNVPLLVDRSLPLKRLDGEVGLSVAVAMVAVKPIWRNNNVL